MLFNRPYFSEKREINAIKLFIFVFNKKTYPMPKNTFFFILLLSSIITFFSCGTKSDDELSKTFDCENLGLNIGDECEPDWINLPGIVSDDCECVPDFDCPDILKNIGDDCLTEENDAGIINDNCECEEVIIDYDCPHNYQGNIGDACTSDQDNPGIIMLLTIPQGQYCDCIAEDDVDCPILGGNIGEWSPNVPECWILYSCECGGFCDEFDQYIGDHCTNPDNGLLGILTEDCDCDVYDCQELEAYIGDSCITDNNQNGTINADCECEE